jgi:REP element-mobilizing transposase RayT
LYGSLPQNVINQLTMFRNELSKRLAGNDQNSRVREYKRLFAKTDTILDKAESGPLWLRQFSIAELMEDALLHRFSHLYVLWSYVVMANHVHVFLKPKPDVTIGSITKRLKGTTARDANKLLKRTGQPFWQDESFDHWSREPAEFFRIVSYIENNPVKAGLVEKREDWKWSSASERKRRGLDRVLPLT